MATNVTISGSTYSVPSQSDAAPWGDELHDTVVALANTLGTSVGPYDIPTTTFQLANNQVSASNITGASFNVSNVRSFILQYSLYRSTNSNEESEVGVLYGTYKSVAATWDMSQTYGGGSGISFSITNSGQIQFTSTNLSGSSYAGKITFLAKAFAQ